MEKKYQYHTINVAMGHVDKPTAKAFKVAYESGEFGNSESAVAKYLINLGMQTIGLLSKKRKKPATIIESKYQELSDKAKKRQIFE